jgi:hypothetical protein
MGSLEYAQARLSARYGERPDELAWRRLEHLRDFPSVIDAARTSAFRRWITGIGPTSTPHDIEGQLRERFREQVAEVAVWMPDSWGAAVRWCATLADLPVAAHLARGGALLPWMRDDPVAGDLAEREAGGFGAAPIGGPLAPLAAAWGEPERMLRLWRVEWRRRLPHGDEDGRALLTALARALDAFLAAMRERAVADGTPAIRALAARLALLFRRATLDPAAAFVYLAVTALDLARLRGELLRRAAFPALPLAP